MPTLSAALLRPPELLKAQEDLAAGLITKAQFKNDLGLAEIGIGVKDFKCIGVSPPDDHPHIYHNMGDQDFIHCLYCNTKYRATGKSF